MMKTLVPTMGEADAIKTLNYMEEQARPFKRKLLMSCLPWFGLFLLAQVTLFSLHLMKIISIDIFGMLEALTDTGFLFGMWLRTQSLLAKFTADTLRNHPIISSDGKYIGPP